MFDDDWEASTFLYPRDGAEETASRPPVTLLVVTVGDNIIFDPAKEELAVAETALAVSVSEVRRQKQPKQDQKLRKAGAEAQSRELRLLSLRTIDPPSRLTPPGAPNGGGTVAAQRQPQEEEEGPAEGVWKAPLGGTKLAVLDGILQSVLEKGGIMDEVLDGLAGVNLT